MLSYILKRLLSGFFILFSFVTIVFFATEIILPGDYVSQFALFLSSKEAAELRTQLGLDLPIWQRYLYWLFNLATGNLGYSYSLSGQGAPVMDILKSTLPSTLLLFGSGTVLAFWIGHWLGKATAWGNGRLFSGFTTLSAILLYTSFPPWLVFLLGYFIFKKTYGPTVSVRGARLLTGGSPAMLWLMLLGLAVVLLAVAALNGLSYEWRRKGLHPLVHLILTMCGWAGSWFILGILPEAIETLRQAAIPLLAYVMLTFGEIMLIMRTTMIDTLHEPYIQTARAKGLPERAIRDRHAARNALLPALSRLIVSLPYLLTGMVMIESVLNWPGVGTTLFYALGMQNLPLAMGLMVLIGLLSLISRLSLDILQAVLDPRIRARVQTAKAQL